MITTLHRYSQQDLPCDVLRLLPLDGEPGTDLPGKSGTASERFSRVPADDATATSADGWQSVNGVLRSTSLLLRGTFSLRK